MKLTFEARLDAYCGERQLRSGGIVGDLQALEADGYYSFSLLASNGGKRPFTWQKACVRVDGGEPWHWAAGQLLPGQTMYLPIAHCNMRACMPPGVHTAVWSFDGRERHRQHFVLTGRLPKAFSFPTEQQLREYRNPQRRRSPYLCGWLHVPAGTRYTQYSVEFQATHLPNGTYCSLGNWSLELSGLGTRYAAYPADFQVHGYGGFQKIDDGQTVSILSIWDIPCTAWGGKHVTLRARRLYPQKIRGTGNFSGEGTGAQCIAPFAWEAKHWYRMHLKCLQQADTTLIEQWAQDLETGASILLGCFDTGVPNACFRDKMGIFLENYLWETAGEVRGMEVRNAKYQNAATGKWEPFRHVTLCSQQPQCDDNSLSYEGSYDFGVTDGRIWMLTSGIGGDWHTDGTGRQSTMYSLD